MPSRRLTKSNRDRWWDRIKGNCSVSILWWPFCKFISIYSDQKKIHKKKKKKKKKIMERYSITLLNLSNMTSIHNPYCSCRLGCIFLNYRRCGKKISKVNNPKHVSWWYYFKISTCSPSLSTHWNLPQVVCYISSSFLIKVLS